MGLSCSVPPLSSHRDGAHLAAAGCSWALPPVLGGQEAAVPETWAVVGVSWLVLGSEGRFQNMGCLGGCMLKSTANDRARHALNRGQMLHENVLL